MMNYLLQQLAQNMRGPATYAWIIDVDHLERGEDGLGNPRPDDDQNPVGDEGITGPSDAPDALLARLRDSQDGDTFKIYDDDGILYYTGRGLSIDDGWDEDACYGPLGDLGASAGAVRIDWPGHSERDCG